MKTIICMISVVVCCAGVGCSAMNHSRSMGHSMLNSMFPTPEDRADTHQDENRVDHEHEEMMLDARKDLSASKEQDGWLADLLHSPEHRSIERSLGVEYY